MRGGVFTAIDFRRMRFLIDRLPMARFRIDKAMARAAKCTASLSGMPGGGGGGSQVERGVELLEAAREAHAAISQELYDMRLELQPLLKTLEDPLQKTAMRMRYIEGLSVRKIAYRITYSEQHIFRVLQKAEKILRESAKDESHEST